MATSYYVNSVPIIQSRTAVVVLCCHFSQTEVDIDLGEGMCGIENMFRGGNSNISPQLYKELILHFVNPLLRIENEGLVLFEVRSDVALTIGECLSAQVLFRNAVHLGVWNFDVIARGFVITDFQRVDACASAFALLQLSNPLLAIL